MPAEGLKEFKTIIRSSAFKRSHSKLQIAMRLLAHSTRLTLLSISPHELTAILSSSIFSVSLSSSLSSDEDDDETFPSPLAKSSLIEILSSSSSSSSSSLILVLFSLSLSDLSDSFSSLEFSSNLKKKLVIKLILIENTFLYRKYYLNDLFQVY